MVEWDYVTGRPAANDSEDIDLKSITAPIEQMETHKFEYQQNAIQNIYRNLYYKIDLEQVEEALIFGRYVTGEEYNKRLKIIQQLFVDCNEAHIKAVKGFENIYNLFNILDKDYIASIKRSIEAIKHVNSKVVSNQRKIQEHQKDIDGAIDNQKGILDFLQKAKAENDDKIGGITKDIESGRIALQQIKEELKGKLEKLETAEGEHDREINAITNDVQQIKTDFSKIDLSNIDVLKKQLSSDVQVTNENRTIVERFGKEISSLNHFGDIDNTWSEVENLKESANSHEELINISRKRLDTIEQVIIPTNIKNLNEKVDETAKNLATMKEEIIGKANETTDNFQQKIKTAYILAGIAIVIAGVSLCFNLKLAGIL